MRLTWIIMSLLCCLPLLSGCGSSSSPSYNSTNAKDSAAMVWVSGGTFTMGSALSGDSASAGPSSKSQGETQTVTLTGYWIYKNEVTVAEYRAFCLATGHPLPSYPSGVCWSSYSDWTATALQQMPVVNVAWADAQAYAAWAGVQLPSEAQYEYAMRGTQENNYPWGGTATAGNTNAGWDDTKCSNTDNSSTQGTWPVGSFPQGNSWCGASDLAGNVWEWCADWYGDYSSKPVTNPTGPGTGTVRVLRGGSWSDQSGAIIFRGDFRCTFGTPTVTEKDFGFRCVSLTSGP